MSGTIKLILQAIFLLCTPVIYKKYYLSLFKIWCISTKPVL